jgi:ribosomal protein L11 methyltransferase
MPSATYWELTVPLSPEAAEGLTNLVWELGALGVVEESPPDGPSWLRAYFAEAGDIGSLALHVDDYLDALAALGWPVAGRAHLAPLAREDWAEAWRAHFRPVAVGRTLLIAPPWEVPGDGERLALVIEPGRAFGTGHHGSTAGCLELIEAVVERARPPSAVDVGTGSGVLAIALARLGVPRVLAFDSDPDAVQAARSNAARNGVGDRVHALLADVDSAVPEPATLVVANLLAAAHRTHAPRYARWVAPGGTLVLGGILDAEATDVGQTVAAQGFRVCGRRSLDGWTSLELAGAPVHHHP